MNSQQKVGISIMKRKENPYHDIDKLSFHINQALKSCGYGMSDENIPFQDIVKPQQTVVLKPNWVYHQNKTGRGMDCMITHPNFIQATIRLIARCKPKKIIIGDAPIQGCDFSAIVHQDWVKKIQDSVDIPIEIIDFRRTIMIQNILTTSVNSEQRDLSNYVEYNLGEKSRLDEISNREGQFRVGMYNHQYLKENHKKGTHRYLIAREPLEADVFINLPKLKTHNKAGLTGAMKNLVGINGSKEFMAHHRIGGEKQGGDCYPGGSRYKYLAERITDKMNQDQNSLIYQLYRYTVKLMLRTYRMAGFNSDITGGWHGNDTVWRMVLDLNRIFLYGKLDGTMSHNPVRKIYSLTDAIIAGDHNGPLLPQPIYLGAVTFSDSSPLADMVHATLMGFDWQKIPMISVPLVEATNLSQQEISKAFSIALDGREILLSDLYHIAGKKFKPSSGWKGHIEKQ